jgi:hypothetical protein
MKTQLLCLFILISWTAFSQQESTAIDHVPLEQMDGEILEKLLQKINAQEQIELILEKTGLQKDRTEGLEKLVKKHAKAANKYLKIKNKKESDFQAMKELEILYKVSLKEYLGEDYNKLLTVVKVDS